MLETTALKLRRFNIIMGILHFIQGILMIFLIPALIVNIAQFQPDIIQYYLDFNPITQSLFVNQKVLFALPFAALVGTFLLISAAAHAIISIPKKTFNIYRRDLDQGINRFRWYEYALSSSIMICLIATLFGIYDIGSLILIFVLNALMNIFGLFMEKMNSGKEKKKVNWSPFIYGAIAGITPWIVIFVYMGGISDLSTIPWFVWLIVVTYFVTFNTFPINMILQYLRIGKWKDYLYGEKVYIVLSLVAKTLLAWLVLFGAMQP